MNYSNGGTLKNIPRTIKACIHPARENSCSRPKIQKKRKVPKRKTCRRGVPARVSRIKCLSRVRFAFIRKKRREKKSTPRRCELLLQEEGKKKKGSKFQEGARPEVKRLRASAQMKAACETRPFFFFLA